MQTRVGQLVLVALLLALVAGLLPVAGTRAEEAASRMVYFDKTGQTLAGAFYDAWEERGGLREVGAPVSQPVQVGERWTQWFEMTRLEVSAPSLDEASAADVQLAAVGRELAERLGIARLHPAFKPVRGEIGPNARGFDNGHTVANAFRATWEQGTNGDALGMPISEELGLSGRVYQFFERGVLTWHANEGVSFVRTGVLDAAAHAALRLSGQQPDGVPTYAEGVASPLPPGEGERWIDINLSTYTLTAYAGNTPVLSSLLVDGAPDTPTVRGTFYVYWKLPAQTMRGRNTDGSEYVTEDVPWVMYFHADFAIHGAYWRSTFGYSGSHGCVNLPVSNAQWLYDWAPYGTRVVVHD